MLKPLEQFICDRCGEIISKPEDGWLEWLEDDADQFHSFQIVHHHTASRRSRGCAFHADNIDVMDSHLEEFTGPDRVSRVLYFLDMGPLHDPTGKHLPRVKDIREFTELTRRLTIPYYEEARRYWNAAKNDGFFDGANELWPYQSETLKELIKRYGE